MRHGVYRRLPLRATSEKLLNGCCRIQRAAQVNVHRRLGPRLSSNARAAASAILGRCSEPTLATGNPIRHTDDTGQAQKRQTETSGSRHKAPTTGPSVPISSTPEADNVRRRRIRRPSNATSLPFPIVVQDPDRAATQDNLCGGT